jgi:NADH-quinone oxidoreductase subunit J
MFIKILFMLSALLTVGGSLGVLITKNIMHACIFLLGSLIGVAGLYVTLGADFVAATQVMVYVGGVVILMLFAVMLTGGKDFVSKAQNLLGLAPSMGNKWTYSIGITSGTVLLLVIINLISKISQTIKESPVEGFESTVDEIGMLLVTDHVLAFELSSVLLVGALVGAAIIARQKRG